MTDYERRVEKCIASVKKEFHGHCIFCGDEYKPPSVAGCHIVPRDYKAALYIGKRLADYDQNLIPGCCKHHQMLDNKSSTEERSPKDRILFIMAHCHADYKSRIRSRIRNLVLVWRELENLQKGKLNE